MAEYLAPGVYTKEAPATAGVIQGVATSNLAIIGRTPIGQVDFPTLVTSLQDYETKFGLENNPMALAAIAFFQNGGSRLYVVRTLEADAVEAEASLAETVTNEDTTVDGDGTVGPYSFVLTQAPLVPGSVVITVAPAIKATGTLTATLQFNDTETVVIGAKTYTFQTVLTDVDGNVQIGVDLQASLLNLYNAINLTGTPGTDYALSMTIHPTVTATASDATTLDVEANTAGLAGNSIATTTTAVNASWGAATLTGGADAETATDNGAGGFTAPDSGTIDYVTGEVTVTFGTVAGLGNSILASYEWITFAFAMKWPGAGGNNYRLDLSGDPEFAVDATATFTKFVLDVVDTSGTEDEIVESFPGIVLDNVNDPDFIEAVVNDSRSGSRFVEVTAHNPMIPTAMEGVAVAAEAVVEAPVYDGTTKQHVYTLAGGSVHETTLELTLSTGEIVTDDGNGGLQVTGGTNTLNPNGTNTVNYSTGVVTITWQTATAALVTQTADYYTEPASATLQGAMAGGSDGSTLSSNAISNPLLEVDSKGIYALNLDDSLMQVAVPAFATDEVVMAALLDYCALRKDRFAIVQVPLGLSPQEAKNWKNRDLNRSTNSYGAAYYPHVTILNPFTDKAENVPAVGHVGGIIARVDNEKNVSNAPAGIPDANLSFAIGLERDLNKEEVGLLTQARVNCLVNWPQTGLAIWGARTLESGGDFGYIQARRLFMMVEKAVYNSTHVHVFKNNGPALWAAIRFQLNSYLSGLFTTGHFEGNTPAEAYFVICDETVNTEATIAAGEVHAVIGLAPTRPAEFVVFTFKRKIQSGE